MGLDHVPIRLIALILHGGEDNLGELVQAQTHKALEDIVEEVAPCRGEVRVQGDEDAPHAARSGGAAKVGAMRLLILESPAGEGAARLVLELLVVAVEQDPGFPLFRVQLRVIGDAPQQALGAVGRGFRIVAGVHVVDVQPNPAPVNGEESPTISVRRDNVYFRIGVPISMEVAAYAK